MKPGEKEMNTLLRNEASSLFFFKAPIRSRSPLLTGSRLISLPLATQMFQFAKFEKSKERRLATELGYGFPIGDPWITDGISPWPFASESVLPSQCPGIHPMHSFRSYLIEDIALERDTKSLPKIEREAIPVRYWSCGFFLLVDFFLRDTLVRAVNPLRQEMRASQSLELPDANNSLEGEFHRYGIRTARRSSILKAIDFLLEEQGRSEVTLESYQLTYKAFPSNPNPPYALHHSQPWMGCFGLCDCARGEVIGAMGSGEGYGIAVECTRDSGFGHKPWGKL
ncbi:hypothetical protein Tco_1257337, partial [Tanacetum coccineum]